jgi:hypothetical protein
MSGSIVKVSGPRGGERYEYLGAVDVDGRRVLRRVLGDHDAELAWLDDFLRPFRASAGPRQPVLAR